jgi:lipopolysaccharide transport system permease protein
METLDYQPATTRDLLRRALTASSRVLNPIAVARHFRQHGYLLWQLTRRNVQTQHRGSWLGTVWSLLTPLVMLGVYTFVFSVVFQSRWGQGTETRRLDFALNLFASLTAFNLFAQSLTSAPGMVLANQNYVKRVVFPLEVLPVARFCANLVEMALGFLVFVGVAFIARGSLPWTFVLLPVVLVPLALWSLGGAFFLAALGVFVRDIQNVINLSMTVLMFMSAVFFPLSAVPAAWQKLLCFNPMVPILEDVRRVCLQGLLPQWPIWSLTTLAGMLVAMAGLAWFMKLKTAFADVL